MAEPKASTNATQNDLGVINEWNSIANLFAKSKGSSQTTTTSSNLTPSATQAYIDSILSGSQGLANVTSGQKGSGLYKSSTNQMLASKLVSDTAAKAALAGAGTTQVTSTSGSGSSGRNLAMGYTALKTVAGTDLGKQAMAGITDYVKGSAKKGVADAATEYATDTAGEMTTQAAESVYNEVGTGMGLEQSSAGLSSYLSDWLKDTAKEEVASAAASEAASSEAGGGFLDWFSSLFKAEGGRIPEVGTKKAWADGGRVFGLRSANVGTAPVINKLGAYSMSQTSGVGGTGVGTGEDIGADAAIDGVDNSPSYTGKGNQFDTVRSSAINTLVDLGLDRDMAAKATGKVGGFAIGLGTNIALGPVLGPLASLFGKAAPVAYEGMKLGASQLAKGIMDEDAKAALASIEQSRGKDYNFEVLQTVIDDKGNITLGRGGKGEIDESVLAETRDQMLAQLPSVLDVPDSGTSQDGVDTSTPATGSMSTAGPDGPQSTSDYGSSMGDVSGGLWAKGGRVHGDNQAGVDDVPIKLGPNAGGGIGMLDGGEVVLKNATVKKLDAALGKGFLDKLNEDPNGLIGYILAGMGEQNGRK